MIDASTLDFLRDLADNNDREWFQAHRARFDTAQDNATALAGYLIGRAGKFDDEIADLDPRSCLFRIYRDVRFAKDKSPYKTNLGSYISPGGRKSSVPGYYLHIQPGRSFIAGGKHVPDGSELLKIRTAIANNTDKFLKIVEKRHYRELFGEFRGDSLKKIPKGFDPDHRAAEYLKLKEFMAFAEFSDDEMLSPDLPKRLVGIMKEMYPLIAFLRNALRTS